MTEVHAAGAAPACSRVVHQFHSLDGAWSVDSRLATSADAAGAKIYTFGDQRIPSLLCPSLGHVLLFLDSGRSIERSLVAAEIPRAEGSRYVRVLRELHAIGALMETVTTSSPGLRAQG